MKLTMKRGEAMDLFHAVSACQNLEGKKAAYALGRNLEKLKPFVAQIQKQATPSKEYQAFQQERLKLVKEYQARDENDKPISHTTKDGIETAYIEDQDAFEEALEKLKKKHKKAIKAQEELDEEINDLLEEEEEFDLYWIKLSWLPDNIKGSQLFGIMPLIKEEEDE